MKIMISAAIEADHAEIRMRLPREQGADVEVRVRGA